LENPWVRHSFIKNGGGKEREGSEIYIWSMDGVVIFQWTVENLRGVLGL
jgi:hypothetical protein